MRALSVATAASLVLASAALFPSTASAAVRCTETLVESGDCITVVVTQATTDATSAGVAQSIARGNLQAAERFVEKRGQYKSDATQTKIEGLLTAAPEEADRLARTAVAPRGSEVAPKTGMSKRDTGAGSVSGNTHTLKDTVTYLYCASSGACAQVGKVDVEFRYTIEGTLDFLLSGDVDVTKGPKVDFSSIRCRTRFERTGPDSTVKTWSNCSDAASTGYTSFRIILAQNWSGGTLGERYHPDYYVKFKPQVPSAPSFDFSWRADSYQVPKRGPDFPKWL